MDFDEAVKWLHTPGRWCDGAKALATMGERRAIVPLVAAFRTPSEGLKKGCLWNALRRLATPEAVDELYDQGGLDERLAALYLMEVFDDPRHFGRLEQAAADRDGSVRQQTLRAVGGQRQTEGWETLLIRLLKVPYDDIRKPVIDRLSQRNTEAARRALQVSPQ